MELARTGRYAPTYQMTRSPVRLRSGSVLTRVMKKIAKVAGDAGAKLRDRSRSVKLRVLAIARASRNKTEKGQEKLKQSYVKLLEATSRVVGQAKKFCARSPSGSSAATAPC